MEKGKKRPMKENCKATPGIANKTPLYGKLLLMATGIARRFPGLARGPGPCEIGPHGLAPARLGLGRRNKIGPFNPLCIWVRDRTGVSWSTSRADIPNSFLVDRLINTW